MTDDTTTVSEPSPTAREAEMLIFALDRSRAQFAWKTGGLEAGALTKAYPPSAMTLGGLVKHLAFVDDWTAVRLAATPMPAPWTRVDWDAEPDWPWTSAAADAPEELYRMWREAGARCRAAVAAVLAEGGLDQQAKFDFPGNELPTARRLLVDLHDEYARHVGHADLLREATDGLVGEDPPQG
jgi:Protein of unknown function (DUF664)